jgi:hypothetical protein
MMRFMIAVLAMYLAAGTGIAHAEEPIQILRTGLWHGDEVEAESGPDWWGIFPAGEGFTLQSAPVTITREVDEIVDIGPDEKTGKRVTVPEEAEPVLLIRGLKNPEQGLLTPLMQAPQYSFLYPGQTQPLSLGPADKVPFFELAALGATVENEQTAEPFVDHYRLTISEGNYPVKRRQTLVEMDRVYEEGKPRLVWAGDIDRDGAVDLLIDQTDHYNVTHLVLFLSSAAKEGEILGRVAEWRTTGC